MATHVHIHGGLRTRDYAPGENPNSHRGRRPHVYPVGASVQNRQGEVGRVRSHQGHNEAGKPRYLVRHPRDDRDTLYLEHQLSRA